LLTVTSDGSQVTGNIASPMLLGEGLVQLIIHDEMMAQLSAELVARRAVEKEGSIVGKPIR